jgi:hypothetical protein
VIAFATLFLGLLTGVAPVTVLVEGPVAEVRVELDGRPVGSLEKAPWTLPVDFGSGLEPHELVARALDQEGKEIAVARQMVNLPRPPAEVDVMLERDSSGRPVAARYSGSSLVSLRAGKTTVTFDDKPLPAGETGRVELPPYEGDQPHVLSVELEFSPAVKSRADVVFGGGTTSVAQTELTAVPMKVKSASTVLTASSLSGVLVHGETPLPVDAVEEGAALVCVVRGPTVSFPLAVLGTGGRTTLQQDPGSSPLQAYNRDASRDQMTLGKGDRVRFLWPITSVKDAAPGTELFDHSRDFDAGDAGIHWLLTRVEHPGPYPKVERLADAAAVAGLQAAASGTRRAVVLVLGDQGSDASRYSPAAVRQYLDMIHVPLFVWSLRGLSMQPLAAGWGQVEDVSTVKRLSKAVDRLKAELAKQRIVWVEGRYLPQGIRLSSKASGVEFAR